MKDYYVEIYNPPFPNKGYKLRVFRKFVQDALSPTLVSVYKVQAHNKEDALAKLAAGMRARKVA